MDNPADVLLKAMYGLGLTVGSTIATVLFEKAVDYFGDRVGPKVAEIAKRSNLLDRVFRPGFYWGYYHLLRSEKTDWMFFRGISLKNEYLRAVRDSYIGSPTFKELMGSQADRRFSEYKRALPLIANVTHTDNIWFWPNWAFSSMLLFTHLKLYSPGANEWILDVRVPSKGIGIYNNLGRRFIKEYYLKRNKEKYEEIKQFYGGFLSKLSSRSTSGKGTPNSENEEYQLSIGLRNRPLRWVAGGVIPILYYRSKWWFAFPYRDIPPVGLNHFGGLSQDSEERKNPRLMALREFLEEFMVLSHPPEFGVEAIRKPIHISGEFHESIKVNRHFKRLQHFHKTLRETQDGIPILDTDDKDHSGIVELHAVDSPFTVRIDFGGEVKKIHDVFFSIDPYELGIEIDFIYWGRLEKNDYILFGEPDPTGSYLIRSPIVLISMDKILESIENDKLEQYDRNDCHECRSLPRLKEGDYYIFDRDSIELRSERMKHIIDNYLISEHPGDLDEIESLIDEILKTENFEKASNLANTLKDKWMEVKNRVTAQDSIVIQELDTHISIATSTWPKLLQLRKGVDITPESPWADFARLVPVAWKVLTMAVKSGSLCRFKYH
ncbi:hypothetical protein A0127_02800 [Thermococcus peptonophilus]|uniref:Uncharacterized protein n=3 Tax=Thermococcus peptonophilus TaxID=53952 RepID=A0A142CTR7_9EURY|nr:hypothetical protein A0127_02800 [Thermococcus peptonophilus]